MRAAALRRSGTISTDLVVGASALAVCAACITAPSAVESGPVVCPFRLATGILCPACGSVRAWTFAAHGRFTEAASFNPFALVTLAAALTLVTWRMLSLVSSRVPKPDVERILRNPVTLVFVGVWLMWWLTGLVT